MGALVGMPLFFLVAGMFTPPSLRRKGLRRYAVDRTIRLLVPSLLFVLVLTPPIEYVDPDAADWAGGLWAFVPHVWAIWPSAPGPTWFLGVLLVFSLAQAPAWIAGFTLGILGGERGWFRPLHARLARGVRRVGWAAMMLCVVVVAAVASTSDLDVLFGGGTWQSLVLATFEGTIVVTVTLCTKQSSSPW